MSPDVTVLCFSPQIDGAVVGFISVTADIDLKQLHGSFELSEFNDLYKVQQTKHDEPAAPADAREEGEELGRVQTPTSQQVTDRLLKSQVVIRKLKLND